MKTFSFNSNPNANIPAPIWPDFHPQSEWSQRMIQAKNENGPNYWPTMRQVFAHDFETLPKNRFKVWTSVWNVPFMSLNRYHEYIRVSLEDGNKDEIVRNALIDRGVGMTEQDAPHLFVFSDFPTTMKRMQAYSHYSLNGWTPKKLQGLNKIVELGGGIGDMCDIAYRLGFEGEYKIYDFPETGLLQRYYMGELGNDKAVFSSNLDDLSDADLVIGTWSFTEMPLELRAEIMKKIGGSKNWLLAYSNAIFGIDNADYIQNTFLPEVKEGKNVVKQDIPWMPWDGSAHYLSITGK